MESQKPTRECLSVYVKYVRSALSSVEKDEGAKLANCSNEEKRTQIREEGINFDIAVKLANGEYMREVILTKKGSPFMRIYCNDKEVNGVLELIDPSGDVVLKGYLEKGKPRGLFREYCNSVLTWMGYFRDEQRYSYVQKSELFDGYYEERRMDDGEVISIAEYDEMLRDKRGRCIECLDGKMSIWIIENGEKKPGIRNPHNQFGIPCMEPSRVNRSSNCELNEPASKRMRVNPSLPDSNMNSLVEYDIEKAIEYGVWKSGEKWYEMKQSLYESHIIESNVKHREMTLYENGQVKEVIHCEMGCIDLNADGRRWEGGVKDGKPYGYGVLYNEEGRKEYEGFMMDTCRFCYGIEYYSDIERVRYEGGFYNDKQFGPGTLFDRNGSVESDGLWKDGKLYSSPTSKKIIDNQMERLNYPHGLLKYNYFFSFPFWLHRLKQMVVDSCNFESIRFFEMDGLQSLESIFIDECCFIYSGDTAEMENHFRPHGCFRIVNCPKLQTIDIGNYSFSEYYSFEMDNLPSLQTIDLGYNCFYEAAYFSLTSWTD